MMMWGFFPFCIKTLPYQGLDKSNAYKYANNQIIGARDSSQFLGIGDEIVKLSGTLLPSVTGGRRILGLVKMQSEKGKAWPLIERNGTIHGFYKCLNVSERSSIFEHNGAPHKVEFDIELKRTDDTISKVAMISQDVIGLLNI